MLDVGSGDSRGWVDRVCVCIFDFYFIFLACNFLFAWATNCLATMETESEANLILYFCVGFFFFYVFS